MDTERKERQREREREREREQESTKREPIQDRANRKRSKVESACTSFALVSIVICPSVCKQPYYNKYTTRPVRGLLSILPSTVSIDIYSTATRPGDRMTQLIALPLFPSLSSSHG